MAVGVKVNAPPLPNTLMEKPKSFARAMPDVLKNNIAISTFTAYKEYIRSKTWVASNYLCDSSRKPWWI